MDKMRFGSFEFPHNPQSIVLREGSQMASQFVPGLGETFQWMGRKALQVQCKGQLASQDVGTTLELIAALRAQCRAGRKQLVLPGLGSIFAYASQLEIAAQGDGRTAPYTIVFVEG